MTLVHEEKAMSDAIPPTEDPKNSADDSVTPTAEDTPEPRVLFNPPIDIYETTDGLVLYADLPGVTAEGLDLQVQDNRLTLFGHVSGKVGEVEYLHQEYKVGDFLRSFILSDEVDHERISARLNNGVLRVELPRSTRTEPRRIEVASD